MVGRSLPFYRKLNVRVSALLLWSFKTCPPGHMDLRFCECFLWLSGERIPRARYPADVMAGYPVDLSSGIPVWCSKGVPCRALRQDSE
ncbi:hypothetical protein LWI28_000386 [Acer negundo]|uniref:Uncharacterized protein n=1 Tax=Acer negundo TaxID=4023 RepID=A0AAD5NEM6_ACENE|nr:hypothetical protein LWI28_000386 [Acer negundo]